MAKLLKLRRGTTSQHGSFTGAEGEVTIDTSKDTAVVHDGSQAGGRPLAREDLNNVSGTTILGRINTNTLNASKIVGGAITNAQISTSAAIAGTKISPNFGSQTIQTTGSSAFPTQAQSDNSTKVATTGYVRTAITEAKPFPSGTKMIFQQTSAPTGWTKVTSSVDNKALRVVSGTAGSGGSNAFSNTLASRSLSANASNTTQGGNVSVSVANATQGGNISVGSTTAGGNVSISSVSTSGTVNSHTLSTGQMPSHGHNLPTVYNVRGEWRSGGPTGFTQIGYKGNANTGGGTGSSAGPTANAGSSQGHSHGFSGSSHSHNGSLSGTAHNHNANFSGSAHSHNASGSFSGTAHNHSISVGNLDMAVQYLDVIIATKD